MKVPQNNGLGYEGDLVPKPNQVIFFLILTLQNRTLPVAAC